MEVSLQAATWFPFKSLFKKAFKMIYLNGALGLIKKIKVKILKPM